MNDCSCQDWKDNIDKINGPIMLEQLRGKSKGYDGVPIRYCPWCGEKLLEGMLDE